MSIQVDRKYFFLDSIILLITASLLLFLDNSESNLPYVGYLLVLIGFYQIYKARGNKFLTYLFVIIGMLNVSIGINDMIRLGMGISEWQSSMLRSSEYNIVAAKSILLFNAVLNLFIFGDICKEHNEIDDINEMRITNKVAATLITVVLFLILGYGLLVEVPRHLASPYESVENTLFEYSIELYILAWLCTKESKVFDIILTGYAIVFSIAFLLIGDRSSASMYLIFLLITRYRGKLTFGKAVGTSCIAIVFFNIISIFRKFGVLPIDRFLSELLDRGLYQDTASWAYYSSISIIAAAQTFGNRIKLFTSFLLSLVGINNEYSSLTVFARTYSKAFVNNGGGFLPAYFYAWIGYVGVIAVAIVVGLLIRKLLKKQKGIGLFYELLLIVFCIRWYVYSPTNIFRSVFIIGGIAYVVYQFIAKLTERKV